MEKTENQLAPVLNEGNIIEPEENLHQSLFDDEKSAQTAKILNVVAGLAKFNLQGERWHTFSFEIDAKVKVSRAVVSLALTGIRNSHTAVNMNYNLEKYSLSWNGKKVIVTGRVYVGDTDGYLTGIGYNCTVY